MTIRELTDHLYIGVEQFHRYLTSTSRPDTPYHVTTTSGRPSTNVIVPTTTTAASRYRQSQQPGVYVLDPNNIVEVYGDDNGGSGLNSSGSSSDGGYDDRRLSDVDSFRFGRRRLRRRTTDGDVELVWDDVSGHRVFQRQQRPTSSAMIVYCEPGADDASTSDGWMPTTTSRRDRSRRLQYSASSLPTPSSFSRTVADRRYGGVGNGRLSRQQHSRTSSGSAISRYAEYQI